MPLEKAELLHHCMQVAGIRAPIMAAAILQLIAELHRLNILDGEAIARIKDAMVQEAYHASSSPSGQSDFADEMRRNLDRLFDLTDAPSRPEK